MRKRQYKRDETPSEGVQGAVERFAAVEMGADGWPAWDRVIKWLSSRGDQRLITESQLARLCLSLELAELTAKLTGDARAYSGILQTFLSMLGVNIPRGVFCEDLSVRLTATHGEAIRQLRNNRLSDEIIAATLYPDEFRSRPSAAKKKMREAIRNYRPPVHPRDLPIATTVRQLTGLDESGTFHSMLKQLYAEYMTQPDMQ